jgi:hypothetical protein
MKKPLLLISACVSLVTFGQQIGNGNMEVWENVGSSTEEPANWNSFMTAEGGLTWAAAQQVQRSTNVRPGSSGSYSARVYSRSAAFGIVANGNLTLGRINMGNSSAQSPSNYNSTKISEANFNEPLTQKPDSLVFWARYSGASLPRVSAVLHDSYDYRDGYNVDPNSAPHKVAEISQNMSLPSGQWVRVSFPWVYTGPATDNTYILVTFTTNYIPGGGAATDEILVDDVELIYNGNISAIDDAITTLQDTPVDIDVTGNDTDPENNIDIPSITVTVQPSNGSVSVNTSTGVITYTPNSGYTGTDVFSYEICDNGVVTTCDIGDVTVTINASGGGNNPIVANNDSETTTMNTPVDTDVTSNDVDLEGQVDLSTLSIVSQPSNGIASANTTTGIIAYTPDAGFIGSDSYVYEICDAGSPATCDQATVNVNVTQSGSGSINENAISFSCVLINDVLSIESVQPSNAKVFISEMSGKMIAEGSVENSFDLSGHSGIILVSIHNGSSVQSLRIMK